MQSEKPKAQFMTMFSRISVTTIIAILVIVLLRLNSPTAASAQSTISKIGGVPSFIQVGKSYAIDAYSGKFTIQEVTSSGWVKATESDGTVAWVNMNAATVVEVH
jgi:hypothetical protein